MAKQQTLTAQPSAFGGWRRWTPLTGVLFVVLFLASVMISSVPKDDANDADWVAKYATTGKQFQHLATGIFLMLAALCLASFLTILWTRIAAASGPRPLNPLPLVIAGISGACIAGGGLCMAIISGSALLSSSPLVNNADLLRFGNAAGFGLAGIAGMGAAALAIACLGVQAYSVGFFGKALLIFTLVVAAILLASFLFIPIVALLVWLIVVAVRLIRRPEGAALTPDLTLQAST